MKAKLLLAGIMILASAFNSYSQELKDIKTPNAPGFVLLGMEPISIQKPTSASAFAAAAQSSLTNTGLIPNIAIESSPYWWRTRPNLTLKDYSKNNFFNGLRNTSFSVVTVDSQSVIGISGTGISAGLRVPFFQGEYSKEYKEAFYKLYNNASYVAILNALSLILGTKLPQAVSKEVAIQMVDVEINRLKTNTAIINLPGIDRNSINILLDTASKDIIKEINNSSISNSSDVVTLINNLVTNQNSVLQELALKVQDEGQNRVGFVWDFAAAHFTNFPDNRFEYSKTASYGAWTTLGYSFETKSAQRYNILGTTRYLNRPMYADSSYSLDFGIALQYEWPKVILSGEYLYRINESSNTNRYDISVKYELSEEIVFNLTFGKNFDQATGSVKENLIIVLGLNYNLIPNTLLR